jgi:hypothetical protein
MCRAYPEVAEIIKETAAELKRTPFAQFEAAAGFHFHEADVAGRADPRWTTADRLVAEFPTDRAAWRVRSFLYHVVKLRELYAGNGYTLTETGERGMLEYIALNEPVQKLGGVTVDLAVVLPEQEIETLFNKS